MSNRAQGPIPVRFSAGEWKILRRWSPAPWSRHLPDQQCFRCSHHLHLL